LALSRLARMISQEIFVADGETVVHGAAKELSASRLKSGDRISSQFFRSKSMHKKVLFGRGRGRNGVIFLLGFHALIIYSSGVGVFAFEKGDSTLHTRKIITKQSWLT
jgi:hypothetical protein